jgi:hypothetical protein
MVCFVNNNHSHTIKVLYCQLSQIKIYKLIENYTGWHFWWNPPLQQLIFRTPGLKENKGITTHPFKYGRAYYWPPAKHCAPNYKKTNEYVILWQKKVNTSIHTQYIPDHPCTFYRCIHNTFPSFSAQLYIRKTWELLAAFSRTWHCRILHEIEPCQF